MSGIQFKGAMNDMPGGVAGLMNSMGGSFKDSNGKSISYEELKAQHPEWYKKGGKVKAAATSRGDGIAQRGKTRGRMV